MDDHDHEEDEVEPGEWTPARRNIVSQSLKKQRRGSQELT
jgi:hypothetical protein